MSNARTALAQSDTNPAPPNILLLVDTSGSMEWKSSTAGCPNNQPCFPACQADQPNNGTTLNPNEKSRWTELLEVLTGSIQNYSCFPEQRTGTAFTQEYQLDTSMPYDLGYENPYHRPLGNLCAPGPGVLPPPGSPYQYPNGAIAYRRYDPGTQGVVLNSSCTYPQWRDGLLDAYDGLVRFGLMTFDTHPDPGTGLSGTSTADYPGGIAGTWSYFVNGGPYCKNQAATGACLGAPWNCGSLYPNEVGARNAAAPPWEGRMVAFGPPSEDGRQRNQWIQEILLATRPYGATPIAGMLADARNFLWFDTSDDPLNPGNQFGPANDTSIDSRPSDPNTPIDTGSCRQEYIILLTDGEPNLELRPECINPNNGNEATCPYDTSDRIVADLANPPDPTKTVRTFVVGFAIGNVKQFTPDGGTQTIDCETMDLATMCNPMPKDRQLKACCTLNNIAWNGTPQQLQGKTGEIDHALFPASAADLRQALDKILRFISSNVTGRTFPVTSTAAVGDSAGVGYEFDTGVNVTDGWRGVLKRKRIQCDNSVAKVKDPSTQDGDDFVATLNKYPLDRTLFTVVGDVVGTDMRFPQYSMRPLLDPTAPGYQADGVGLYKGAQTDFVAPDGLAPLVPPEAMSVSDTTCDTATEDLTKIQCRDRLLNWAVGVPNAATTLPSRCTAPDTSGCNVMGDIFHSLPQIRGKPSDLLADDTYTAFATTYANRDRLLYVSSNDGFLHSFLVSPGDLVNDTAEIVNREFPHQERWAFIPPAVLPFYFSMYPGNNTPVGQPTVTTMSRMPVLDGTAIIKDVGATQVGTSYTFDRKRFANAAANEVQTWRTILVEGFGPLQSGYFALDITKPGIVTGDATSGPKFLWQLTTDDQGHHLFGKTSPNPLVTTLFFNTGAATEGIREVSVAILPGGDGDSPTGTNCSAGTFVPALNGTPAPRTTIRCYDSGQSIGARSLTIVRLDTGQIVRTFRPNLPTGVSQPVAFDPEVVSFIDIPSPIVGQPVAYPAQTGQIADRIFVGDRDGRIWRLDVSDTNPKNWTMQVFFDAYYGRAPDAGQPIQTPPVLSIDGQGQITVAFATGDQDNLVANSTMTNFVMSTTEVLVPQSLGGLQFNSRLMWQKDYTGGERAVGPLTMFDRVLYYSTVNPAALTSADCHKGFTSTIHASDYLQNDAATPPRPQVTKPDGSVTSAEDLLDLQRDAGTIQDGDYRNLSGIVAGVGLRQMPSCSTITTGTANTDAFFGFGTTTGIGQSNPGSFQLVFQRNATKGVVGSGSGSSSSSGSGTGSAPSGTLSPATQTLNLAAPNTLVRVDSWAPIIE